MSLAAVELGWMDRDRHAVLTGVVLAAVVAAVGFAVIGLPPIGLHAPPHHVGVMAPSCGLTRGTVAIVRGSFGEAMGYNPASPLVVLFGLAVLGRALFGSVTAQWLELRVRLARPGWVALLAFAAALAVNQQLHAELLR